MQIKEYMRKLFAFSLNKKSNNYYPTHNNASYIEYMKNGPSNFVGDYEAYNFYNQNAAVSDAVSRISEKFASITPIIKNQDGQAITQHEVLDILKTPNKMQGYFEFAEAMATNYLLSKNAYIKAISFKNSPPKELYVIKNDAVSISETPNKAIYTVTLSNFYAFLNDQFKLTSETGRILTSDNISELVHIRGFGLSNNSLKAMSILSSIESEIDMISQSNNHNLTVLKDGFNSKAFLSVDTEDQDVINRLTKDIRDKFSGSGNNGKVFVSKGKDIKVNNMAQTNKDMEYSETKRDARNTVYQRYEIPMPLVDSSSLTFNNYKTAQLALYDDAVFPLFKKIYSNLGAFFKNRGMLEKGEYISYDEKSIPALQLRLNEQVKNLSDANVATKNELRSILGMKPLGEESDVLYIPSTLVPIGSMDDDFFEDEETGATSPTKDFVRLMKKNYKEITKDEIKRLWDEHQSAIK